MRERAREWVSLREHKGHMWGMWDINLDKRNKPFFRREEGENLIGFASDHTDL